MIRIYQFIKYRTDGTIQWHECFATDNAVRAVGMMRRYRAWHPKYCFAVTQGVTL